MRNRSTDDLGFRSTKIVEFAKISRNQAGILGIEAGDFRFLMTERRGRGD
jgi:hypothetical protein